MKQFIAKNHKLFAIFGSIIVISIIVSGLIFGPFNSILPESLREKLGYSTPITDQEFFVQLIVNFGGQEGNINQTILFVPNETTTAYSILLKANLTLEIKEYPNGIYISSIEGVSENATHYWQYLVDGDAGIIAANRYDLISNNAQEVSWLYKRI